MPSKLTSNGALESYVRKLRDRSRDVRPATAKIAQFVQREAARRAPVGSGPTRGGTRLRNSLNAELLDDVTISLRSHKPYAAIQARGGTIRPGTGPLAAKMLVVPLSEFAKRYINSLGAGTSLRNGPIKLVLIKGKSGKLFLIRAEVASPRIRKRDSKGRLDRAISRGLGMEFMFMLIPQATLRPNPEPKGYAPSLSDPVVESFALRTLRSHFKGR
jgi:hypothetical protein